MSCCSPHKKQEDENKHSSSPCCSAPKKQEQKDEQSSCCSAPRKQEQKDEQSSCCSAPRKQEQKDDQSSCCSAPKKQQTQATHIHRQMTIEEILGMFPFKAQRLSQEITNAGLHCIGCHAAVWETLEAGMYTHGKTDAQIEDLVRRLNALLDEEVDLTTIQITPRGASKFLEILSEEGKQGWGMRFAEEMAGCSGFEYVLDFSEKSEDDDEIFVSHGIEIHIKKKMIPRLRGSLIDYVEGLKGSGFKISNPNVRSACGCGSSHNY